MNSLIIFNKTLDSTWKTILILAVVIVAIFALFGLIGRLVEKIMYNQGKKIDKFMSPLILSGLVNEEKKFHKIATQKSRFYFFKTSVVPLLFILIGFLMWLIYHLIIGNWNESIFNDKTGIGTLFFTWNFSKATYYPPLGFANITLQNTPHFLTTVQAINYFIFLFIFIGLFWYLFNVQGYISRMLRIKKLEDRIFSKDLENVDLGVLFNQDNVN